MLWALVGTVLATCPNISYGTAEEGKVLFEAMVDEAEAVKVVVAGAVEAAMTTAGCGVSTSTSLEGLCGVLGEATMTTVEYDCTIGDATVSGSSEKVTWSNKETCGDELYGSQTDTILAVTWADSLGTNPIASLSAVVSMDASTAFDGYDVDELSTTMSTVTYTLRATGSRPVSLTWSFEKQPDSLSSVDVYTTSLDATWSDCGGHVSHEVESTYTSRYAYTSISDALVGDGAEISYTSQYGDDECEPPDWCRCSEDDIDGVLYFGGARSSARLTDWGPATDLDGDGSLAEGTDCHDGDPAINVCGNEICDGADQDCDGTVDDGEPMYPDLDGDGWGALVPEATDGAVGLVCSTGDCDELDSARNPGQVDGICDGVDMDCDGVDEGAGYRDLDEDGFGGFSVSEGSCEGMVFEGGDCDDSDAASNPEALEVCDALDNDCDLLVDAEDPGLVTEEPLYQDVDGDGFGAGDAVLACGGGAAALSNRRDDCDDNDASIYPGAAEPKDGVDHNCDGTWDPETDGSPKSGCAVVPAAVGPGALVIGLALALGRRRAPQPERVARPANG